MGWILFALAVFVVVVLVFTNDINEQFKRNQGRMVMPSAGSLGVELKQADSEG